MKPSYTFISHPSEFSISGHPRTSIELNIYDREVTLGELLEQFELFIKAAGYCVREGDYLNFVNDEEDEAEFNFLTSEEVH